MKEAKKNKDIVLLTGDLGFSVFEDFEKKYPNQFFNIGISEQNMMGIAAGLAFTGKKVFVYSIAPFVTFRCLEQIRNDIAYPNLDVVIVGAGVGFAYGAAGFSHHSLDDFGAVKVIPNMTILSPSCPFEVEHLIKELVNYKKPVYLRLGKCIEPITPSENQKICIGKPYYLFKEKEIALITYGCIIEEVFKVYKKLKEIGKSVSLISVPTIKPLDINFFDDLLKFHKYVFVIEEHNEIGGLGESLFKLKRNENILINISISDKFITDIGDMTYLRKKLELDNNSIFDKIIEVINGKK